jgi:hypothetical protein
MNNVLVCEKCGTVYAAFVFKGKKEPFVCESLRRDRPGLDGACGGKLTPFGHLEPWRKA